MQAVTQAAAHHPVASEIMPWETLRSYTRASEKLAWSLYDNPGQNLSVGTAATDAAKVSIECL